MIKNLYPVFMTSRLKEARDSYVNLFGFKLVFEAEWYVQLHLDRDGNPPLELAFMLPELEEQPESVRAAFAGEGMILAFDFDDVNEVYRRLVGEKLITDVVLPIRDEPWGQRHFMFRDPAGVLIDAVQLIPPSSNYIASYLEES